jgi:hemolysin III
MEKFTALMPQSPSEEVANAVTHGVGLVLSVVAAVVLLPLAWRDGSGWTFVGCGIYSASLIVVYAASMLSHALRRPKPKRFFIILDPAVIYLLIAGTYTPFGLMYLSHDWWWLLSAAIWAVAITGFFHKLLWPSDLGITSVLLYVLLGWLPVVALGQIFRSAPVASMWWLIAGGLFYTIGTAFLLLDERIRYFHAVWHLFVMAGSASHYAGILLVAATWTT